MRNNKGQALVEFILILPVFLMLLFLIIDFGMIFTSKSELESTSSEIVDAISSDAEELKIKEKYKDYVINISIEEDYKKIIIRNQVNLITPGISIFLNDPYEIITERYIYNETE